MLSAAQVRERALALRGADPETTLTWAVEAFPGRAALTVSFGGGGVVLAHLLSRIDRTVPVIFLDTGFHFPETYAFKERFAQRYGLNVVDVKPSSARSSRSRGRSRGSMPGSAPCDRISPPVACRRKSSSITKSMTGRSRKCFRWRTGVGRTCGATSGKTASHTTRCSIRATRASGVGRAPALRPPAKRSARGGGAAPARPSAGCTRSP